jgi:hypothetical protein
MTKKQGGVSRTMTVDTRRLPPAGVAALLLFVSVISVLCIVSATVPAWFAYIVHEYCGYLPAICINRSLFYDSYWLSKLGYENYAVGFQALRSLSITFLLIEVAILAFISFCSGYYKNKPNLPSTAWPPIIAAFCFFFWWILISDDFYFAKTGEIRTAMTPPVGTADYIVVLLALGALVAAFIVIGVRKILYARGNGLGGFKG